MSNKFKNITFAQFMFALPLVFLFLALLSSIRGWVLTYLWSWFVLPLFPSLPKLSIVPAIGLSLVANFLLPGNSLKVKDQEMEYDFFAATINPILALWIGWIIHIFFM